MNSAKKTIDMAHQTWLAGIGVFDSGREKAANKFDQIFVDGSAFVSDLLEKGELVESQLQAKVEARKMLKDKILALKEKFGFGNEKQEQQIEQLSQRVDNLIEVVAKLAQQQAAEKKAPATSAVKPTAKAATKPAAKATAKKATDKVAAKPVTKVTVKKAPVKSASKPAAKASTAVKNPTTKAAAKPATKVTATKVPANTDAKPVAKAVTTEVSAKSNADKND